MSFLAPFYLLTGLAIGLPVAFHMIRRTPQGRQLFSSVMFLNPSPPRLTRRSRIEDWLLLILRSLAVVILALAFARPFLRAHDSQADIVQPGQRIAILLDRSASMQQPGYWEQSLRNLSDVLTAAQPQDSVSILLFDRSVQDVITFEEWGQLPPAMRAQAVQQRLQGILPGWNGTAAGQALITAVERLQENAEQGALRKTIVLISDLQSGGGWQALNGYSWPAEINVRLLPPEDKKQSNASLQAILDDRTIGERIRFRITNVPGSIVENFRLYWLPRSGMANDVPPEQEVMKVSVPRGQSRVVQSPPVPQPSSRGLVLQGDDIPFDNVYYIVPQSRRDMRLLYIGPAGHQNPPLRFFLNAAFPDTPARRIELMDWPDDSRPEHLETLNWLIIAGELTTTQSNWTKNWMNSGGQVLFVARNSEQAAGVYELLSLPPRKVEEAAPASYAMLGDVDFSHPVLKPFADPRYADFTKVHFWHLRRFAPASLPAGEVLMRFDDGIPALMEIPTGRGRLILLASSWDRADSDLAMWSKFVPLLNGLLDYVSPLPAPHRQAIVGDELFVRDLGLKGSKFVMVEGEKRVPVRPDERLVLHSPGIKHIEATGDNGARSELEIAVNLSPEESRTDRISADVLETMGIPLTQNDKVQKDLVQADATRQRQLMSQELEARQQIWIWLLTFALILLFLETAIAGWKGRASIRQVS
jgi:hypothetical protein